MLVAVGLGIISLSACSSGAETSSFVNSTAAATTGTDAATASEQAAAAGSAASPSTSERVIEITAADLPEITALGPAPTVGPARIVSLATGVGETLVALGVGDRVVGRDETSQEPASAEVVTKAHEVSAERVLALDPDLVIVDARTTPPEALDQIRAAGVTLVEVPEAWTLNDMAPRTAAIAEAVGADATSVLAAIPSTTGGDRATSSTQRPRVAFLYLRGTSAVYLLGGAGSGADAMITAAGGIDVGAEAGLDAFVPLTAEALVQLQPDVLLVMTKGLDSVNGIAGLLSLPGVAQTPAGETGRVIAVDDEILLSFGPRTGSLIDLMGDALQKVSAS